MLFSQLGMGQTITVFEVGTKQPIPYVAISNSGKDKSVFTDINGKASLDIFQIDELLFFDNFLYEAISMTKAAIAIDNFQIFLKPNVESLNQIVLSASKFEQRKRDIPQTIISLDAGDIKLANPQTSADLLDNSGNIFIQKSQLGGGSPMIRGFSTNRLLITIDGVRMNNAIFRGGNVQNVISIDPLSVQNTEVTLGSGSVIYGSDAIGGVMSFYTKKPTLSDNEKPFISTGIMTRYSSANNEKTGHTNFNLGYKKWGFLTNITYTDFDDLRMGSNGPEEYLRSTYVIRDNGQDVVVPNSNPERQIPTGYSQVNLMQKVRFTPSQKLNFDFGIYFTTTSDYPRYDRLIRPDGNGLRSAEWDYGPQQWFMTNFQMTKRSSRSNLYDKLQTTLAYQNFKESRKVRRFQSPLREVRAENVNVFSFNLDFEKRLTTKISFSYGLEYLFNYVGSESREEDILQNTSSPNVTRYPDGSTWQSAAAYANFKYRASPKLVFQSGLRYNQIVARANFEENNQFLNLPFNDSEVNTGALTGSAGFSWFPSDIIRWKLNFSTAFRAPNIDDIGKVFDSEPGSVVIPNNDLEAEYAYGGELGLLLNFDNKVRIDLGTYYTFLDNALIRRNAQLNGATEIIYDGELSTVQSVQNASKAWIYGFEAGIEVNVIKALKLRSQYNVIGGTEDNNNVEVPIRHVAPNFGRTHLIWNKNRLLLDAFVVYNNELSFNQLAPSELSKDYIYALDENGNPYSPSWYTFNLRSQYTFNDHLSLTASLENITDQRYRPYSSGIAAPGRNLIIAVQYNL
ncbi:TonB-dependent receptor plug domain-containing protein [Winogradskyella pelagia]|nr:TonB-dependent receptor [Winogradskyella sp. DF17]